MLYGKSSNSWAEYLILVMGLPKITLLFAILREQTLLFGLYMMVFQHLDSGEDIK